MSDAGVRTVWSLILSRVRAIVKWRFNLIFRILIRKKTTGNLRRGLYNIFWSLCRICWTPYFENGYWEHVWYVKNIRLSQKQNVINKFVSCVSCFPNTGRRNWMSYNLNFMKSWFLKLNFAQSFNSYGLCDYNAMCSYHGQLIIGISNLSC